MEAGDTAMTALPRMSVQAVQAAAWYQVMLFRSCIPPSPPGLCVTAAAASSRQSTAKHLEKFTLAHPPRIQPAGPRREDKSLGAHFLPSHVQAGCNLESVA